MRLIDRKSLEAQIKEAFRENPAVMGMLLHWIRKQPTVDAVPVVRCTECAYSYDSVSGRYCSCGPCVDCFVPDSFFCSYGERRYAGDAEMHSANG